MPTTSATTTWPKIVLKNLGMDPPELTVGGLLADLKIGELLERAHERRVVPRGASMRCTGVEELLRRRGVGQRYAERAARRQREVQVLLMQLDAKAGIERALDHALAVHLEDARRREAAHQRLPHLRWVG